MQCEREHVKRLEASELQKMISISNVYFPDTGIQTI